MLPFWVTLHWYKKKTISVASLIYQFLELYNGEEIAFTGRVTKMLLVEGLLPKMLHRHPPIRDIEPKSPEISGAFNFKMGWITSWIKKSTVYECLNEESLYQDSIMIPKIKNQVTKLNPQKESQSPGTVKTGTILFKIVKMLEILKSNFSFQ